MSKPNSHVGGSTYDVEFNGAPSQTVYFDSNWGTHAVWMFSTDLGTAYPDRNMRYNFLPKGDSVWRFNTTGSFMEYGYNAFTGRAGYGMLDVNPGDGVEHIDAHQQYGSTPTYYPSVVRDEAGPGEGGFVACAGSPTCDNYLWPAMGISPNGKIHVMVMLDPGRTDLYYSTVQPWCTWSTPTLFPPPGLEPGTPDYNVAASKVSGKVVVTWVEEPARGMWVGYYKTSNDTGLTWSAPVILQPPDIHNVPPDTAPMFWETSLYPYYDNDDSLHIAATVNKAIQESLVSTTESALADWSSELGWRIIYMAKSDTEVSHQSTGYEPYADRVSMALAGRDTFVAVWEQFDAHNIEPRTKESRSDIYSSVSTDRGVTWSDARAIACGGTISRRYPFASRNTDHGYFDVVYLEDVVAGQEPNPSRVNPFVCQLAPIAAGVGARESKTSMPGSYLCRASPTVFRSRTTITYALPRAGKIDLKVYDAVGRPVRTLAHGAVGPGRYTTSWNGKTSRNTPAPAGVYFYALSTEKTSITGKLTLLP